MRPRPVLSRASRPAAAPMQANSAAPVLGSGCGTCTGAGRKPGMPASTPTRAMTRSSTGGSSRQRPCMPYAVIEQATRRGFAASSFAGANIACCGAAGAKSCNSTSAPGSRRLRSGSAPAASGSQSKASFPRSQTVNPPWRCRGAAAWTARNTRAPESPSSIPAKAPAAPEVRSRTVMPSSGSVIAERAFLWSVRRLRQRSCVSPGAARRFSGRGRARPCR